MKIDRLGMPVLDSGRILEPIGFDGDKEEKSFGEMLGDAINGVNNLQKAAEKKNIDMAAGKVEDISEVMIAAEKSSIALQLTIQVRNKVVEAYQEIMRMQM